MHNTYPLVSVIIPVYNCEQYICETIESVLNQSYPNFEIIVIDDGSTDNSKYLIETKYKDKVLLLEQQNGGPSKARNLGIKNAKGEYIAFLDADDLWEPDKTEKQIKYMLSHPEFVMTYTGYTIFNENNYSKIYTNTTSLVNASEGWLFKEILYKNFICLSSIIVKHNVFNKIGLFNENLITGEDVELFLRIAYRYQIGYVNKNLIKKRNHNNNLSHQIRSTSGIVLALENLHSCIPELNPQDKHIINNALIYRCINKGKEFTYYGMVKDAFVYFKKAINYTPFSFQKLRYILLTLLWLSKAFLKSFLLEK